jgi:small-conductance mechanosensitive channel
MIMSSFISDVSLQAQEFKDLAQNIELTSTINAIIYFMIGLLITFFLRWFFGKITERNVSRHHSMVLRQIILYVGLILSCILPLKTSGIDVSALLGAAGILTAAVAFAAQTSISNFLSGLFLVAEKPFVIGDYVQTTDMIGEVLSIDLLSVKIRTRDNVLVRIPNESLLKAQFFNLTRFPIRRFDMKFRVAFNENLTNIKRILLESAAKNPICLASPVPELIFLEFAESGVLLQFSVWAKQASFSNLQTEIQMAIQQAFADNDIELPTTHPSMHA